MHNYKHYNYIEFDIFRIFINDIITVKYKNQKNSGRVNYFNGQIIELDISEKYHSKTQTFELETIEILSIN